MPTNLLVVESPAKARTIKKYLGSDYEVLPSYGHVRDLVPKDGAVEPENGFLMHYELISRNAKHVNSPEPRDEEGRRRSIWRPTPTGKARRSVARCRASPRRESARREAGAPGRLPRDHQTRDQRRHRESPRDLDPRSSMPSRRVERSIISSASICLLCCGRRFDGGAVRGSSTEPGPAHDRRARRRDRTVREARVLDHRS